jgi:hypothetical protein
MDEGEVAAVAHGEEVGGVVVSAARARNDVMRSYVATSTSGALAAVTVAKVDVAIGPCPMAAAPGLEGRGDEERDERARGGAGVGLQILELRPGATEVVGLSRDGRWCLAQLGALSGRRKGSQRHGVVLCGSEEAGDDGWSRFSGGRAVFDRAEEACRRVRPRPSRNAAGGPVGRGPARLAKQVKSAAP